MARQPVREPRDAHDRRDTADKKPAVEESKAEPVAEKDDKPAQKDETNLDDKAE
jgi:cell division protease FtsH